MDTQLMLDSELTAKIDQLESALKAQITANNELTQDQAQLRKRLAEGLAQNEKLLTQVERLTRKLDGLRELAEHWEALGQVQCARELLVRLE